MKLYKKTIEACFPQIQIRSLTPILEGWDSLVLEVNGELIFRFPRRPDVEAQLRKEICLLPALARALSAPVPHFEFVWPGNDDYAQPFVGYWKIRGVPLTRDHLKCAQSEHLTQQLARFLSELHSFPAQQAVRLKVPHATPAQWRQKYEDFYVQVREQVFPLLGASRRAEIITLWESFLTDEASFRFQPVLIHADLGAEHVLWDPDTGGITGIIDWGDATLGDPALDFVGLLYDHGPDFTGRVLAGYQGQVDETFWQRMVFYARLIPFYEILFGLLTGDESHIGHGLELI